MNTRVWKESVTFKTYLTGKQDPHPIFLEHRVYQGSSGAVYPYGVTDTLQDKACDLEYEAVFLENDYIQIMILPELGGRIQRAYDKVNKRDFVYFNHVVKPALVGLLGPWISGGIEFNWPQHHRPTTYMPVDCHIDEHEDGSASVTVGETEPMHGLTISTTFTVYKDKALVEIKSHVFNGNQTPRSFLWWSNPAVRGGEGHQSVFPPDVTAVFDHGKRAVIDFPIAHGEYYKVKYDGVDISRYKNLPVPTSYMAWKSNFDFVGAYCHDEEGGLLHVADHHISPGKKQWTWGNGEFGQAWDKLLTDSDGPYIELMTGVFTDNQPDFTWIDPGEEKEFCQNFLPYAKLGTVQNANTSAVLKLERENGQATLGIYAVSLLKNTRLILKNATGTVLCEKEISLNPCQAQIFQNTIDDSICTLMLVDTEGKTIISYTEYQPKATPLPEVAPTPALPSEINSSDEAFLIGQHLEQYHHASRQSVDYYNRGLEIDALDYRCNIAIGQYEYNRGCFSKALHYAEQALTRQLKLNRNPDDGKASLLKGDALKALGQNDEAYESFFRGVWSQNGKLQGFCNLAKISLSRHDYSKAIELAIQALDNQRKNPEAWAIYVLALSLNKQKEQALVELENLRKLYPVNAIGAYLSYTLGNSSKEELVSALNNREINYLEVSRFLCECGREDDACKFLDLIPPKGAIATLVKAALKPQDRMALEAQAKQEFIDFVRFPNSVFEKIMLSKLTDCPFALHLVACFNYSHRLYEEAADLWQKCIELDNKFTEAYRGLGIYAHNRLKDDDKALNYYQKALELDPHDERILFEYDLLQKNAKISPQTRLELMEKHKFTDFIRDDLKCEYVTLLNNCGRLDDAYAYLTSRIFHVWEGGEGKVTGQFIVNAIRRAQVAMHANDYKKALKIVSSALTYPENLGEGRLVVQTDNDLYYIKAIIEEKLNQNDEACIDLNKASLGETDIHEQQYYNDTPCDYVFFNALARLHQGKHEEAQAIFKSMQEWSKRLENVPFADDFFAVSLPELIVLDQDKNLARQESCILMQMLGALGLGDTNGFDKSLSKLLEINPSNHKAYLYADLKDFLVDNINA